MKKPKNLVPEPGDYVEAEISGKTERGVLLEGSDKNILLLKLNSGYNVGFRKESVSKTEVLEKRQEKKSRSEIKLSGDKPLIDFYLTGGTISSKLDPETGGVKSLISEEEFFSVYPEILSIANIRIKSPFMKLSENMNHRDWIRIARAIRGSLKDPNVRGIIISHGTDTLHYTGAALSFMLRGLNKPVVLTYSQRSSDRGSSDSRMNLKCATHTALSDIAEVVLVGHATTNDDFCYVLQANKSRKMHSSKRDAFKPINCSPIARVFEEGKIEVLREHNKRAKNFGEVDAVFDERVALIKYYPGQNPDILDYYKKKGYRGLVIEMTGLGHVCAEGQFSWVHRLKKIIKEGMFVYAASQTIYGRLDPYVYSSGRKLEEAGVVFLKDILSETAFVKLGWVLGHRSWRGSVATKIKMLENISNEFNDRLESEKD